MRSPTLILILCHVLLGCGDDASPPPGTLDASSSDVLGMGDATVADAGGDVPGDARVVVDAGALFPLTGCTFGDVEELSLSGSQRSSGPQVAATTTGFGVVYSASPTGPENIYFHFVPTSGELGEAVLITNDNNIARSPTIAPFGDGFIVGWYDNESGGFEVRTRVIGVDGAPSGAPVMLSDNLLRDDAPALAELPSGALAVWVEDDDRALTRLLRGTRLDSAGALVGSILELTGTSNMVDRPIANQLGDGALVVWGEGSGVSRNAFGLYVNADGSAGVPIALSAGGGVGSLAFATNETGSIAFNVGGGSASEVFVVTVGADGAPSGEARQVNIPGDEGGAPGITAFEEGYVVGFSARREGEPVVRLSSIDVDGAFLGSLDGPALVGAVGVLQMATAGRTMLLSWGTTELRSVRVSCP
ncbi:MAG: hypothetical protein ACI9KE_003092 [Polyangiales bacterium]